MAQENADQVQPSTAEQASPAGGSNGLSLEEQLRLLREENARLRAERDEYRRHVFAWVEEKFTAKPLPLPPPEGVFEDTVKLLQELEQQLKGH